VQWATRVWIAQRTVEHLNAEHDETGVVASRQSDVVEIVEAQAGE